MNTLDEKDLRKNNRGLKSHSIRILLWSQNRTSGQTKILYARATGISVVNSNALGLSQLGTRHVKYLEENVAAGEVELTKNEVERLDGLFAPSAVAVKKISCGNDAVSQ